MDSFLGSKEAKKCIKAFLESDAPQTLVIISPNGSGKTTFCNLALATVADRYRIYTPNLENLDTHKQLTEQVNDFICIPSRFGKQGQAAQKQCLLFFDDIEILFSQDRYASSFLGTLIDKTKMLLTCSTGEERKTTEFKKKNVTLLRLELPDIKDIVATYGEHMRKQALAAHCNVGLMLKGNNINMKYFDKNIYEIVGNMFAENDGVEGVQQALAHDQSLISFMMYDNFQKLWAKKKAKQLSKSFLTIAKTFLDTSIAEDFIFKTNDGHAIEALNIIRCQTIRREVPAPAPTPTPNPSLDIQYTQINSRSAQHYNIIKKVCDQNVFFDDIAKDAEHFYASKKKTPKTDYGTVMNAYILNYCKSS